MKVVVIEKCNTHITNYKDMIVGKHVVESGDIDGLFKKVYGYERGLRYCNGYWIEIEDAAMHKRYKEWLKRHLTIDLYYGGGCVYD